MLGRTGQLRLTWVKRQLRQISRGDCPRCARCRHAGRGASRAPRIRPDWHQCLAL